MRHLNVLFVSLFFAISPAMAQWQTPSGTIPVGRGAGAAGFNTVGGSAGAGTKCLIDTTPPTFGPCSGTSVPGGINLQVQYNNAGSFGGLTNTQLTAYINSFSSSLSGAAPASGGGTNNFLRADGSWAIPSSAFIFPASFGAKCDGTTDDTTALDNLVDYAFHASGVTIQLVGNCKTTSNIPNLHAGNFRWSGPGLISRGGNNFYPNPLPQAGANTIFIDPAGNDANDGLSPTTPIATIQQFFTIVANYAPNCGSWTGSLAAGTYPGATMPYGLSGCVYTPSLNLSAGHIQLNGPQPSGTLGDNVTPTAFIDGNSGPSGQTFGIGMQGVNALYLSNIYLRNWSLECLFVNPLSDLVTINVWMAGCVQFGVSSRQSHVQMFSGTINGSTSIAPAGIQVGVSLLNSTVFTLTSLNPGAGVVVKNASQIGVLVQEGSTGHFDNSTSDTNVVGIYVTESSHVQVQSSIITNNTTAGIERGSSSSWLPFTNTITGNGNANATLVITDTGP